MPATSSRSGSCPPSPRRRAPGSSCSWIRSRTSARSRSPRWSWADALALGREAAPPVGAGKLAKNDLACLIYTSGTGASRRACVLSHDNIMGNIRGGLGLLDRLGLDDEGPSCRSCRAVPRLRAHGGPVPADRHGRADLLRRRRRDALDEPGRGVADHHDLRAAALRGPPPEDHRRRRAAGRIGKRLFHLALELGRKRYHERRLPHSPRSTARSTAWSGGRCRPASAAGSRRWCRAARRSTPTSGCSSTRWAAGAAGLRADRGRAR